MLQSRVSILGSDDSGKSNRISKTSSSDIHRPNRDHTMNLFDNAINTIGLEERNKAYQKSHMQDFPVKSRNNWSADADMKEVNPFYKMYESEKAANKQLLDSKILKNSDLDAYGASVNCATCSIAYNLRRDGYDVHADASVAMSLVNSNLNVYYPGASWIECDDDAAIKEAVADYPDGAHGILTYTYTGYNTGHAIAWEKEDGHIVYRDCQVSKSYTDLETSAPVSNIKIARLDDRTPDLRAINEAGSVKPSKEVTPVVSTAVDKISSTLDKVNKAKRGR